MYVGIRDFWLQEVSGDFRVNVTAPKPAKRGSDGDGSPARVFVTLGGTGGRRGFAVHLRAFHVGIKGEKGTRVPGLNVSWNRHDVAITVCLASLCA